MAVGKGSRQHIGRNYSRLTVSSKAKKDVQVSGIGRTFLGDRIVKLAASILATGSGSAMIGSIFGPVGAVVGGVIGSTAAYVVEANNEEK